MIGTMVQSNRYSIDYSKMVVVNRKPVQKVYDPTRTTSLRNAFVRQMTKRFAELKKAIKQAIIEQDCFGLTENKIQSYILGVPAAKEYKYMTSEEKITAFMEWLKSQERKGILQTTQFSQLGSAARTPWTNMYIEDSYKRGVIRARYELGKAGYGIPKMEQTGGIFASMNTPFHMDRVGLLFSRTFTDLKGITDQMDSHISRILSQGMIDGDGPRDIARKLLNTIDGNLGMTDTLGRFIPAERRAITLARTETIRAHHLATVQEYRNWGAAGVNVEAEIVTAQDENVCEECDSLTGQTYTLDEAEGLIPVHPNCRCIVLPVLPEEQRPVDENIGEEINLEEEI